MHQRPKTLAEFLKFRIYYFLIPAARRRLLIFVPQTVLVTFTNFYQWALFSPGPPLVTWLERVKGIEPS